MSDWEHLATAEDISKGDYVIVENADTGESKRMKVRKVGDKVELSDGNQIIKFDPWTLEDEASEWLIVCKDL
jgi:hypothetical protein